MKIERFEDIESWQLARELTGHVYGQGLISVKEQWVKIHYPATAR